MDTIAAEQAAFAWNQVEEETLSPKETSINTLSRILNENKNTIFGKENNFENLGHEEFSLKVPLSRYNNHESYIERIVQGERNVLSHTDVNSFYTSSGTTGKTKLIPHTTGNGPQESPGNFKLPIEKRVWFYSCSHFDRFSTVT
jgi:acyl-coenzyme A synthetase/AMP-(fatty) acid ligase